MNDIQEKLNQSLELLLALDKKSSLLFSEDLKAIAEKIHSTYGVIKKQLEEKEKEAEKWKKAWGESEFICSINFKMHEKQVIDLQSQLSEKDKEYKEHVEKLCRNIRILEERVKDGDKELSELKAKHNGVKVFRNVQTASKVELILKPEHMNTVFTWKQIQDAIMKDDI